jgi:hypothetical protein
MASAGDVNTGKAWRTVRRPSDMVCLGNTTSYRADQYCRMNTRRRSRNIGLRISLERSMANYSLKVRSNATGARMNY